ncbi:MFS transporter [Halobacillus sp. K22]|uniref:MFS transporter n=1 Tax=Halobacillus sp. K22 TaxID=3457431 RepID=UPI003FCE4C43
MKRILNQPAAALLVSIGISNLGDWIYLIALNLMVLKITGSPLAVALLYILNPLGALSTSMWAGSFIDRTNQRRLMIQLDILRAVLVCMIPFVPLAGMYVLAFLISMGSAVFRPASTAYITKVIGSEDRVRFNAWRGLSESGGFIIGPAIAGIMIGIGTVNAAFYLNSLSFLLSGLLTFLLPVLDGKESVGKPSFQYKVWREDWSVVRNFSRRYIYVALVYFLFNAMIIMTAAVDSLEAAFSKDVLGLSDREYGGLVSIAGTGIAIGALTNALAANRLPVSLLMGAGSMVVSTGYLIYACSQNFMGAAIGFFVLSFALAFASTGFITFYQRNVPVDVMGRVGSIYEGIESVLIIIITVVFGLLAEMYSLRMIVSAGSAFMLICTLALTATVAQPSKRKYYEWGKKRDQSVMTKS